MKCASLSLLQLSSDAQTVLVVRCRTTFIIRQYKMAQIRRSKGFQSGFSPFVETFEQRNCKGVLQTEMACFVEYGISMQHAGIIEVVGIIVFWGFVCLVYSAVVVKTHCVDEACYRHIFIFHPRRIDICFLFGNKQAVCRLICYGYTVRLVCCQTVGRLVTHNLCIVGTTAECLLIVKLFLVELSTFAACFSACQFFFFKCLVFLHGLDGELPCFDFLFTHFHFPVETYIVAMSKEYVLVVITIPILLKHSRYFTGSVIIIKTFRMSDIVIIGYTSVLRHFLMVG